MNIAPKNILVFADWYYPGYRAGGPIQSIFNLVTQLSDDFKFSIFTRSTDYLQSEPYKNIVSDQWTEINESVRIYYASPDQLSVKLITRIIEEDQYTVIYLNSMFSKYFSVFPLWKIKRLSGVKVILAPRGMLAEGSISIKRIKKLLFLRLARLIGLFNGVIFQSTSEHEKLDIQSHLGMNCKIRMVPNIPGIMKKEELVSLVKEPGHIKLVSIARIAPEKNLRYALELLKEIKGLVELDIYGSVYDKAYWDKCLDTIKLLPENVVVKKHDSVPNQEVFKILANHHFLILPTPGENFGHIVFEALSSGCPPVISDMTPWKELKKNGIGWSIPLDDNNSWMAALAECIEMNQENYTRLSRSAYAYASRYLQKSDSLKLTRKLLLEE
ncbi:MAG: hypothetical protein COB85_00285 [Bacteroidetes bacterium]|nr:MAG: hypothetical protein COB85_00285 [Bacteroidota bacterium]